jgi:hypothetical protein
MAVFMSNCAAPPPDPYVGYIMQRRALLDHRSAQIKERKAEIEKMPPGAEKDRALDELIVENRQLVEDYNRLAEEVDRERPDTRDGEHGAITSTHGGADAIRGSNADPSSDRAESVLRHNKTSND